MQKGPEFSPTPTPFPSQRETQKQEEYKPEPISPPSETYENKPMTENEQRLQKRIDELEEKVKKLEKIVTELMSKENVEINTTYLIKNWESLSPQQKLKEYTDRYIKIVSDGKKEAENQNISMYEEYDPLDPSDEIDQKYLRDLKEHFTQEELQDNFKNELIADID